MSKDHVARSPVTYQRQKFVTTAVNSVSRQSSVFVGRLSASSPNWQRIEFADLGQVGLQVPQPTPVAIKVGGR